MKTKEESKELHNLLQNITSINTNAPSGFNLQKPIDASLITQDPIIDTDFDQLKSEADSDALKTITNAIKFIIPDDMLENNEYIQDKLKNDTFALSGMLYQIKCNEAMQRALMEQIKSGFAHPRMFEVFSGVTREIRELNKQFIQSIEALKLTYKDLKQDIKEKKNDALSIGQSKQTGMLTTKDGSVITRGTKELILEVKKFKESFKIEDAKIEETNSKNVDNNNME